MQEKYNDATYNRPEGARVIDDAIVTIDIQGFINQIKNEEAWHKNDRNAITMFKTDNCTIVLTAMHQSAVIDKLNQEGLITVQVLEGSLAFTIDSEDGGLGTGNMLALHKGCHYTLTAMQESVFIITVYQL